MILRTAGGELRFLLLKEYNGVKMIKLIPEGYKCKAT